jgi:hypothetical protein
MSRVGKSQGWFNKKRYGLNFKCLCVFSREIILLGDIFLVWDFITSQGVLCKPMYSYLFNRSNLIFSIYLLELSPLALSGSGSVRASATRRSFPVGARRPGGAPIRSFASFSLLLFCRGLPVGGAGMATLLRPAACTSPVMTQRPTCLSCLRPDGAQPPCGARRLGCFPQATTAWLSSSLLTTAFPSSSSPRSR